MCGIAGYWNFSRYVNTEDFWIREMTEVLSHRGPNAGGIWKDQELGIALGHRRLAILDLSEAGHQPMVSEDRRYILVFNGEIYNFRSLAKRLETEGVRCLGKSDTEVLLKVLMHYGVPNGLGMLNGMFSFAFLDRVNGKLYIARDRFGEKPLYFYSDEKNIFMFASELKSFLKNPLFKKKLCKEAMEAYLQYNYIPCPLSIYENTYKLFPGTYLTVSSNGNVETKTYFSLETLITQRTLTNIPEKEHIYNLNQLLSRSVCDRMVSDVPVGAFLSGGIDSSLICALMQINSRSPIKTFTVGYHNSPFDESPYAERIARYLGTEHTTLYVDEKKALWAIDHTIDFYDEPFGDLSAVATYLICELFKEHVTVALSGDGGDEIFCGYNRHIWAPRIAKYNGMIPSFIKSPLAKMLLKINPIFLDKVFNRFQPFIGDKIYKVLRSLNTSDILKVYLNSVSYFRSEGVNDLGEKCWYRLHRGIEKNEEQVAYLDMRTYLHDDVLCKVDRASMAVGLETRAPFLDYDLVAYTWNIPVHVKLKKNIKKYLSKKILETYVPKRLWDRPKMGFGIPVSSWMRTSLKTYFENIIFRDSFVWEWYSKREIIKLWQDHLSGRKNNELCLWNIFVAQKWASQMFG